MKGLRAAHGLREPQERATPKCKPETLPLAGTRAPDRPVLYLPLDRKQDMDYEDMSDHESVTGWQYDRWQHGMTD